MKIIIIIFIAIVAVSSHNIHFNDPKVYTLVTALWNQNSQEYRQTVQLLKELLKSNVNLIIFGQNDIKEIAEKRSAGKTLFIEKSLEEMKNMWFRQAVPNRKEKQFINSVMDYSKMYLLGEAQTKDKFSSDEIFWFDLRLMKDPFRKHLSDPTNLQRILNQFKHHFLFHTVEKDEKLHDFEGYENTYFKIDMTEYVNGDFFGGVAQAISSAANMYDDLLKVMIIDGNYWSEDALYSMLCHRSDYFITYFSLDNKQPIEKKQYKFPIPREITKNKTIKELYPQYEIYLPDKGPEEEYITLSQMRHIKKSYSEEYNFMFDANYVIVMGGNILIGILIIMICFSTLKLIKKILCNFGKGLNLEPVEHKI